MAKNKVKRVAMELDIPFELLEGTPRITMWGNERVWVENHEGIMEYAPARARFKSKLGEIVITGDKFIFEQSGSGSTCITGKIVSVTVQGVSGDAV